MKSLQLKTVQKWFVLSLTVIILGAASCNQTAEQASNEGQTEAPSTTIQEATFFGNIEAVKGHIAAKTDLNQKDAYGSTPLHIAATFGKTNVALLLISGGANLNEKSADGSTPLHTAAFFGRTDIVKALLENKADVTIRNTYNATALESVSAPFADMKPIYDQMSKDLGPFGLKLDYKQLEAARPVIAEMIQTYSN
ncbi:MAG: ankyrin repeat domain-containing protein [Marinoscillum sp.]|uniref:ankyrin repeat domain-containing protein n=1 Tax=Marinoscillum sp. TaxID=2024838 RepID=UPI0032F2AA48